MLKNPVKEGLNVENLLFCHINEGKKQLPGKEQMKNANLRLKKISHGTNFSVNKEIMI